MAGHFEDELDPGSSVDKVPTDETKSIKMIQKNHKYSENLDIVRKNTILPQTHAKSLNYKLKQGISMLAMTNAKNLKAMKNSTKFETKSASQKTGGKQRVRNNFQRLQTIWEVSVAGPFEDELDPGSSADKVPTDKAKSTKRIQKNQKYSKNLDKVRKHNLKTMKNSKNFRPHSANWITGDVSRFDFNDELVNENESHKRLIRMFFMIALILLIIANILIIPYSSLR